MAELGAIYINRFITGLYTNRSPLLVPVSFMGQNVIERNDALLDGSNVEVTDRFTLQRRFGFSKYSTAALGLDTPLKNIHSFRELSGAIHVIAQLSNKIAEMTPSARTDLLTLSNTNRTSFQSVADTLYFANGTDAKKLFYVAGVPNVSGLGLAAPASLRASVKAIGNSGTANKWTLARVSNVVTVTCLDPHGFTTGDWVYVGNMQNSSFEGVYNINVTDATHFNYVQTGPDANTSNYSGTITYFDMASTDSILFAAAYKNSTTGHVSAMQLVTHGSTKFTGAGTGTGIGYGLSVPKPTDPQVDKVVWYATLKNGSTYFQVGETSCSSSQTAEQVATSVGIETVARGGLSTQPEGVNFGLVYTSILGSFLNYAPPTGLNNLCFHMGRMWGTVGNKVYFAVGGETIAGIPEESWPPLNYFTFPGNVVTLVSTKLGLLVFLTDDVYLIRGIDQTSFYPNLYLSQFGVSNPDCVVKDGESLYIYTTTKQLYELKATSADEIGFPIEDVLATNFNPATTHLTIHKDGKDNALYLVNNNSSILRYSLKSRSWSPLWLTGTVGMAGIIKSVETATATYNLLMGGSYGYVLKRDYTTHLDDGTQPTGAFLLLGTLLLTRPGQVLNVDAIAVDYTAATTNPTVKLNFNEVSMPTFLFTALTNPQPEPAILAPTEYIKSLRYYLNSNQSQKPTLMRFLQILISFPDQNVKDEVLGIGVIPNARA
jgi:hypothetical protein